MRIAFTPSRELFPFESRWFETGGLRVHYVDEGTGRPMLMCHGNPTWSFLYRKVITRLRDRFRCVAVDYPGFGLSDRPAGYGYTPAEHAQVVGRLVDHLGLDGFLVMGQDWGGPHRRRLIALGGHAAQVNEPLGARSGFPAHPLAGHVRAVGAQGQTCPASARACSIVRDRALAGALPRRRRRDE